MIHLSLASRLFLFSILSACMTPFLSADESSVPQLPTIPDGELIENVLPFEPIEKRKPEVDRKIEAGAHFMNGVMLEKRGEYQEAMREYAKAIQIDQTAVEAYRSLIMLNVRFRRPDTAQRLLVDALKHAPDDAQLLQLLGSLRRQLGQIPQSIGAFESALKSPEIKKNSQQYTLLRMELGPLYRAAGMTEKTIETYEFIFKALKTPENYGLNNQAVQVLSSDENLSYETIGQIFLNAEKYDLALQAFNDSLNKPRLKKEEIRYFKAKIYLAQEKPQRALEELTPYLEAKLQSQGLGPYQLLSDIYVALDRESEIASRLQELQQENESNNFIMYALAEMYQEREQNGKAIELYQKAIGRGADPEAYQGLMGVYFVEGRASDWLGALSGLLGLGRNVDGIEDQFKQVSDDEEFMQKLVAAARELKDAGSRKFNFPEAYIIGRLAAASKRTEYVMEFYQMAMDFRPARRTELTGQLAQYLSQEKEYLKAAEVLEQALNAPGNPRIKAVYSEMLARTLLSLSFEQEEAGEKELALETLVKARTIVPDDPFLQYSQGVLEWRLQQSNQAIVTFRDLLKKVDFRTVNNNSQLQNLLKQAHFVLSAILVQEGQLEEGQKVLEVVYEFDPDDPSVNNDLGYLYADQNIKLEQARKMIRLALDAEPDNHAYLDSMGWVLYRLGEHQEALKYLLKAVTGSEEGDATLWDHLGDVYTALGNETKATESWKEALKQAEAEDMVNQELINTIRTKLGMPAQPVKQSETQGSPLSAPKPTNKQISS